MDNNIMEIIQNVGTYIQPALSSAIGVLFTTLFVKKNSKDSEFEKIKAGKFNDAINELLTSGKMSYYEYYKCNNFLKVAKLADRELEERAMNNLQNESAENTFEFDWFMRFFDSVGSISNEDMQKLWAKILAGEIQEPGSFSLRTLETIRNMTTNEAKILNEAAEIALYETDGNIFLFFSSDDDDDYEDVNIQYEFGSLKMLVLEECGLLNGMWLDNIVEFSDIPVYGIYNENILLEITCDSDSLTITYKSYAFTETAKQLFSVIKASSNNNYLLDLGRSLQRKYSEINVKAYKINCISDQNLDYDKDINLLE